MKKLIYNIFLGLVSLAIIAYVLFSILKASSITFIILAAFFLMFMLSFWLGRESTKQLNLYYKRYKNFELTNEDNKKILFFSLARLSPLFFVVLVVSFIPLMWVAIIIPVIILVAIPASVVCNDYYVLTKKKLPFIVCTGLIIVVCLAIGTTVISMLM